MKMLIIFYIVNMKNCVVLTSTANICLFILNMYIFMALTGQNVTIPTETPYTSLHDVFACFATPSVMWKPMEVDADAGEKVTDSLKLAFDDPVSKLKFVFVQQLRISLFRVMCI
jgi:hypothetical protein